MYQVSYPSYRTPAYGRFRTVRNSTVNVNRKMKVYYLMEYLPSRYEATEEQERNRRSIYSFKNGSCSPAILNGLADGIMRLGDRNTVVCFVPASSHERTQKRYATLSSRLAYRTKMRCSYKAISKAEDSPSGYLAGKSEDPASDFVFDSSIFSGKKVILIDDVMTRGRTLEATARRLRDLGATEVIGLVVGLTINPDWTGVETRNVERL